MNLIFVHVPKCAGTSLYTALKSVYEKDLMIDRSWRRYRGRSYAWQWFSKLPFDTSVVPFPSNIRCIAGHFTHVKYTYLGWPKFIFLRDPFSRVISHYSVKGHRKATTFGHFVRTGENAMSRMVGDLRQYFFVGLQEHFDESMDILEWKTGMTMERKHRNYRRAPVYEPTGEEQADFFALNGQDIDLYKRAKEAFEKQRREYGKSN